MRKFVINGFDVKTNPLVYHMLYRDGSISITTRCGKIPLRNSSPEQHIYGSDYANAVGRWKLDELLERFPDFQYVGFCEKCFK